MQLSGQELGSESQFSEFEFPVLPLASCVILEKLTNHSGLFSFCEIGIVILVSIMQGSWDDK